MTLGTRLLVSAALGVAALALPGCGDVELRSHPLGDDVVVDGRYDDWKGRLEFVEQANMSVGAQNDDTHLYLIVVIGDREVQRNVMMSGMYLWFDAAGEKDRQFGVHFPLGVQGAAAMMRPPDAGASPDPEGLRAKVAQESLSEAELIAANGSARITRGLANLPGVDIRTRNDRGAMVYEYRVPLAAAVDSPYGIGTVPGGVIGVGLVTPEIDLSQTQERMRARMDGDRDGNGPAGGGRGGMGGGGGGMRGMGGPPQVPEAIDVWVKLTLAEAEGRTR